MPDIETIKQLNNASGDIEISTILDGLSEETINNLLKNDNLTDTTRARISILEDKEKYIPSMMKELGYNLTQNILFSEKPEKIALRSDVYQEMVYLLFDDYKTDLNLNPDELTVDEITKDLFDTLLYDSSSYEGDHQSQKLSDRRKSIILGLIPNIREIDFLKRKIETSYFLDKDIHIGLKKQILLLHSPDIEIGKLTDIALYEKLKNTSIDWLDTNISDVVQIPFDVILDLIDMRILTTKNKLVISEFNNQEQLIQLYRLQPMKHDRDIIVSKLEKSSIIRLIETYDVDSIIHYIDDRELLRELFYEINATLVKASIALLLDDRDLAFEIIDSFLHNPEEDFIPQVKLKELLILLNKKQLAMLRMSSPSKYQQYILQIVKDKERRDDHDNAMFA